jgi:hypothetical protein
LNAGRDSHAARCLPTVMLVTAAALLGPFSRKRRSVRQRREELNATGLSFRRAVTWEFRSPSEVLVAGGFNGSWICQQLGANDPVGGTWQLTGG